MTLTHTCAAAAIAAGILVAGCGKSDVQTKLEQAADSAKAMAQQMQKNNGAPAGNSATGESAQEGAHKPVPAVDFHKLESFLPTIAGYTAEKPDGANFQMNEVNYSSAEQRYNSGDASITVTVFDYAYIESLIAAYKTHFSFENDDGYAKSVEMSGFPGWETFQKNDKAANTSVLIGDRFVVAVEGHGQADAALVHNTLASMNLKGIAALQ